MNNNLLQGIVAVIAGMLFGAIASKCLIKFWPQVKRLGTTLVRPFSDPASIQKRENNIGAAAREHQTKPETRNTNRPVCATGGISMALQFQGRYDANGVILELSAEPDPGNCIHGFIENPDGTHRPRTVLEGCEGSYWTLTRWQIRTALIHYIGIETSSTVDSVPPAIEELLSNAWPEDVEFRYPFGGTPVLRYVASLTPWDLPVRELLEWAVELHQHPSPPDMQQNERLFVEPRAHPMIGAIRTDTILVLGYVGEGEAWDVWTSGFELRRRELAERSARVLSMDAGIQSVTVSDAFIGNLRLSEFNSHGVCPAEIVSPPPRGLTANNPGQIESSSSNASNEQRPRRMRIRGRR